MSAFTSAAQGDNCCGQRKIPSIFQRPSMTSVLWVWSSRGGKYSNSKRSTGSTPVLSTSISHRWRSHLACDCTSDHRMCGWPSRHTEVDYEKLPENLQDTSSPHLNPKPRYHEHHHDGTDSVAERLECSRKIYARARLHRKLGGRQRQTYSR
jgi:hypothetical protein